jgi:hypothetical protein
VLHSRDVLDHDPGRRQIATKRCVSGPSTRKVEAKRVHDLEIIAKVAQSLVAVEAEQSANFASRVVVVDMVRRHLPAAGAHPTLPCSHSIEVCGVDAIAATEMEVSGRAVVLDAIFAAADVVARLAVIAVARRGGSVPRELTQRLRGRAIGAPPLPSGKNSRLANDPPDGRLALAIRGFGSRPHADLAIAIATRDALRGRRELV